MQLKGMEVLCMYYACSESYSTLRILVISEGVPTPRLDDQAALLASKEKSTPGNGSFPATPLGC